MSTLTTAQVHEQLVDLAAVADERDVLAGQVAQLQRALAAAAGSWQDHLPPLEAGWTSVYRNTFDTAGMRDVSKQPTSASWNAKIAADDSDNKPLQHPVSPSLVYGDDDGLHVVTDEVDYTAGGKPARGFGNGRCQVGPLQPAPPLAVRVVFRMPDPGGETNAKMALGWWPKKGWPYEVDGAETFGGARDFFTINWHFDVNGDGQAREQPLQIKVPADLTGLVCVDTYMRPERMWARVNGVLVADKPGKQLTPDGPGRFFIGKALTKGRSAPHRRDELVVRLLEEFLPA